MRSIVHEPGGRDRRLSFCAIADDLTGGVELASILVANGVRTETFVGDPTGETAPDPHADAIVVAARTRVAEASWATETFRSIALWLEAFRPRQMFFKYCGTFDSTPAGNIGCCAEVLSDIRHADKTLFCPTFPENGRTVYCGHLFVGDRLVSESSKRFDPLTPMNDPNLVSVLRSQSTRGVGLLPRNILWSGSESCMRHLEARSRKGETFFIADAIEDNDLRLLAELTVDWPLMTGGSTVVNHYPPLWRKSKLIPEDRVDSGLQLVDGPAAVISGSCSDRTLAQLRSFEQAGLPVLTIDLRAGDEEAVFAEIRDWIALRIGKMPFAIATSADVETVAAIQSAIGQKRAAHLAERMLARTARMLVEMGIRRLAVAGGETSGAVVDALGIRRLNVGPYVPKGIALASAESDLGIIGLCLKSGRIGADDVFLERLAALAGGRRV
jgi:3-dehydrotetronate 4-kinase